MIFLLSVSSATTSRVRTSNERYGMADEPFERHTGVRFLLNATLEV